MSKSKSDDEDGKQLQELLHRAEKHAATLRKRAGVEPLEKLDPRALANKFKLKFITPDEVLGVSPEQRAEVENLSVRDWSGIAKPLPNAWLLVMLNSNQTPERANVTIMEEVAHAYYEHKPSQLITFPDGSVKRLYDKKQEEEAYFTAGAALLPSKVVAQAIWREESAQTLVTKFGASLELVEMRIKIWSLWSHYKEAKT
jgi:hypothetical protein